MAVITIACRMTSTRLPGKIMKRVLGRPLLELMIERVKRVKTVDDIILATTTNASDDCIEELAKKMQVGCFRGDENNVLLRIYEAASTYKADVVVQLSSDCVLIDPNIIEHCIETYEHADADFVSNALIRSYPQGMDTEVFSIECLRIANEMASSSIHREHVTLFIYQNPQIFKIRTVKAPDVVAGKSKNMQFALDTIEDYNYIKKIYEGLYPHNKCFCILDILNFVSENLCKLTVPSVINKKKSASEYWESTVGNQS